jgi:voltage-gated potassium channel
MPPEKSVPMIFKALKKLNPPIIRHVLEGRFYFLMGSLLAYFALVPFLENFIRIRLLLDIFLSAILLSGIYAISQNKRHLVIAAILALAVFISIWVTQFTPIPLWKLLKDLFLVLFFVFSIVIMMSSIFKTERVTADVIYAAIVVYLYLGLVWSMIFAILESVSPGSFSIILNRMESTPLNFTYYSYVTLTTLGYGDIVPLSSQAKSFSMLEAIVGQIYLTVIVARLVALQISHASRKKVQ